MIITFRGEHNFLSNFFEVDVNYNGLIYASVEHAYMSAKSNDPQWKAYCANRNISASDVKREGKTVRLVDDWENIKLGVMETCLRAKFNQEPLKSKLLATGNQNIQEGNTWSDTFWGVDLKSNPNIGENHLGRLLMKIRDDLNLKSKNHWENFYITQNYITQNIEK
jgi:ribA/ribD-fused uncharacterized protein